MLLCLCGGKLVVAKSACGAVRMHACSVHSNAPGQSGQEWSLDRLTRRPLCSLFVCLFFCTNQYAACPSFLFEFITAVVVC